ncbi:UNVERIFIED_CONTAM: hypothetical protein FKN15_052430 [Acipenser sinensis]
MAVLITCAVVFLAFSLAGVLIGPLPDFSDPLSGFEPRGTEIGTRMHAWSKLQESTEPGKLLSLSPNQSFLRYCCYQGWRRDPFPLNWGSWECTGWEKTQSLNSSITHNPTSQYGKRFTKPEIKQCCRQCLYFFFLNSFYLKDDGIALSSSWCKDCVLNTSSCCSTVRRKGAL